MRKLLSVLLLMALLLSLAACGGKGKTGEAETSDGGGSQTGSGRVADPSSDEYIISSYSSLPVEITNVGGAFVEGDRALLCCREGEEDEAGFSSCIASTDLNGGNFEKLPIVPPNGEALVTIAPDRQGNIWCLCRSGESMALRRYDLEGGQLTAVSVSGNITGEGLDTRFTYLASNSQGQLCVAARYVQGTICALFDSDGTFMFSLENQSAARGVIVTAGDSFALCTTNDGDIHFFLEQIDMNSRSWVNGVQLGTVAGIYSGSDGYDCYVFDEKQLLACSATQREPIFNWASLGLSNPGFSGGRINVCPLGDGRFAVVSASYNTQGNAYYEYCVVERGHDDRAVLTMTSLRPDHVISEAVAQFNKADPEYRVELDAWFSYSEDVGGEEWNNAVTKFNTQLITGQTPDIIDLENMPIVGYTRNGILEDMFPYLQNDPDINQDDFFMNVFDAVAINGKLSYIPCTVSVGTMLAKPSANIGGSWTLADMSAWLDSHGEKAVEYSGAKWFLEAIVLGGEFVDLENGTCSFDSPEFIDALDLCVRMENGTKLPAPFNVPTGGVAGLELLRASASSPSFLAESTVTLGGDVVVVGFPGKDGPLHSIRSSIEVGMSANGQHKDGAWRFIKTFLTPQIQEAGMYLPVYKPSFERLMAAEMEEKSLIAREYSVVPATQKDVDLTREILSAANQCSNGYEDLVDLVLDNAQPFFEGQESAESAAKDIQGRAQMYLGEQS